jgi:hypothetical protein
MRLMGSGASNTGPRRISALGGGREVVLALAVEF